MREIVLPLNDEVIRSLHAGDTVLLSGTIYSARDAAHRRMAEAIEAGDALPIPIDGQCIYYMGPSPAPPGRVIGSAGPTSSYRMDAYTPMLLERGLKAMIGKGPRSEEVVRSMKDNTAVYFAAVGGAAALLSRAVKSSEIAAYEDLGPEAVRRLTIESFPVTVAVDCCGHDQYAEGRQAAICDLEQNGCL